MQELDKTIKKMIEAGTDRTPIEGACPTEETLAGFFDGVLGEFDEQKVRDHLLECGDCRELSRTVARLAEDVGEAEGPIPLKLLRRAARLDPAKEGLLDVVVKFGQEMVEVIRNTGEAVSYAKAVPEMVRSGQQAVSESLVTFAKVFPPFKAEVEVEKVKADRGEITVRVRGLSEGHLARGLRVSMFEQGRELESYLLNEDGEAVFENVRFGLYRLNLIQTGKEIGKISLNMKGEGSHG